MLGLRRAILRAARSQPKRFLANGRNGRLFRRFSRKFRGGDVTSLTCFSVVDGIRLRHHPWSRGCLPIVCLAEGEPTPDARINATTPRGDPQNRARANAERTPVIWFDDFDDDAIYRNRVVRRGEKFTDVYWRIYVKHQAGWTGGGPAKLSRATSIVPPGWRQAMIAHVWSSGESLDRSLRDLDGADRTRRLSAQSGARQVADAGVRISHDSRKGGMGSRARHRLEIRPNDDDRLALLAGQGRQPSSRGREERRVSRDVAWRTTTRSKRDVPHASPATYRDRAEPVAPDVPHERVTGIATAIPTGPPTAEPASDPSSASAFRAPRGSRFAAS